MGPLFLVFFSFLLKYHSSALCFCRTYSVIFSVIKAYLTDIETWSHIQACSCIFSTLCNLGICWALAYLEAEAYLNPSETLTRHIQNSVIGHYLAIFRHIQNLVQRLHVQKPDILEILKYSELFQNFILTYIQNPVIFTKIQKFMNIQNSYILKTRHIQNPVKHLIKSFLQKQSILDF